MDSTPPQQPDAGTRPPPAAVPAAAGSCGCGAAAGRNGEVATAGVRLAGQVRMTLFNSAGLALEVGTRVVVESDHGTEIGDVIQATTSARRGCSIGCMRRVLRAATPVDIEEAASRGALEAEAREHCRDRIAARGMPMKLVRVEQAAEAKKIVFFFTAESRVDFRELVKELAQRFHCRIEMRQIGVRDEAGVRGGYGDCGRALCCSTFLKAFAPISIRMAREQNLSLNPSKISGMCGRLKCCLRYEYQPAGGEPAVPPEDEPLPPPDVVASPDAGAPAAGGAPL
jgi:cell fate regulator YaaT (PSP1 superfamily)